LSSHFWILLKSWLKGMPSLAMQQESWFMRTSWTDVP
jgi:hypothetical protein